MTVTDRDGVLRGPERRPLNLAAEQRGSIHDDETAQRLGFRGGTVAGSIHMDQFPPLLVAAFGERWFETGGLSLAFRHATTGDEPVTAFVQAPTGHGDEQVDVWMDGEGGVRVAEGTASVGNPAAPAHLHAIDLRPSDPAELRIFSTVAAGDPLDAHAAAVDGGEVRRRIERGGMTEPLEWYTGASPWGGPVASPSGVVQLLWRGSVSSLARLAGGAVGLFGAIAVRHHRGPVFLDREYLVTGEIVAVGQSPKTEYVWFDAHARDDGGGPGDPPVASMRMQLRWMKASAPQYRESDLG